MYEFPLSVAAVISGIVGTHMNSCYPDRFVKIFAFELWTISNVLLIAWSFVTNNLPLTFMYCIYTVYSTNGIRTHCESVRDIPQSVITTKNLFTASIYDFKSILSKCLNSINTYKNLIITRMMKIE